MRGLTLALSLLGGCYLLPLLDDPDRSDDPTDTAVTIEEDPSSGPYVEVDSCGDFQVFPSEWTVERWSEDVFHIATVVWVEGQGEDCLVFEGAHEYTGLELQWSEGAVHWIDRPWDGFDHAGFGPRACDGSLCEVGDIFESDAVYPGYPRQGELQELIETYGPPDSACAHVANADLFVATHCGRLESP